jgi:hypothetical protein
MQTMPNFRFSRFNIAFPEWTSIGVQAFRSRQ